MKKMHTTAVGIIAGLSLTFAGAVMADPGGPRHGFGPRMDRGHAHGEGHAHGHGHEHGYAHGQGHAHEHGHGSMGAMGAADHSAMADAHLAEMKARLKITATQETAWQTFAAAARDQAAGMEAMRAQMQQGSGTAPDHMAQRAAAMQKRGAAMANMAAAFKSLYAVLTPEQKALADQQHPGMMGRGGMQRGHGRHAG